MGQSRETSDRDRNDFEYSRACGPSRNATAQHVSGVLLIGGAEQGPGEDAATRWFLNRARGGIIWSSALAAWARKLTGSVKIIEI